MHLRGNADFISNAARIILFYAFSNFKQVIKITTLYKYGIIFA